MIARTILALLAGAIAASVGAAPATAKDGVAATLSTRVPRNAEPGTRVHVAWTLTYAEGERRGQRFDASGIFVRLASASGASPETAFADDRAQSDGRYAATVVVPKGGIGDVEIGLVGWSSGPTGTRRADILFPITNDPLPGPPRVSSNASGSEASDGDATQWLLFAAVASLVAVSLASVAVSRRRRTSHA